MRRAKYAWPRRTTPINIHIILQKDKEKIMSDNNKVLDVTNRLPMRTSLGGFSAENVLRSWGTCSILSNNRYSTKSFSICDLFFRTTRGITSPLILETKSNSSLERLDSMFHPVKSHRLSTYSLLPQICNHFQEFWNLAHIIRLFLPFRALNGRTSCDEWKTVSLILDIKPSWFLVDDLLR